MLLVTLEHIERKGLVDLEPNVLPIQHVHDVHDDKIARPITHLLANFEYVYRFPDWA